MWVLWWVVGTVLGMAKRISDPEEARRVGMTLGRRGRAGVDWEAMADGALWLLERGKDFPEGLEFDALRYSAYGYGRARGLAVSVRRAPVGAAVRFTRRAEGVSEGLGDVGVPE